MMKLNIQRFAYILTETTTESNINVTNNTSDVTTTIKGTSTSSYKQNANWTITIDGTGYGGSFNATTSDNNRVIATRTKTVTHTSNGSKTISYGGTLDMTGTSGGFLSVSGNKVLTKIPRASYPTLVDFVIPNAFTIVTNRASENFTHTLTLKIAGATILTRTSVGASVTITPSESEITALYTALANAYVLPYTLVTQTYDGATLIGTTENTANCFVNSDTNKPIFSTFTYMEDDSTVLALTNGTKYLKNFSNVKATISSSNKAVGQNSATIVKYIMTIGSQTTEALYSTGDVTLTIANIDSSTVTIQAVDSRGLRTTVSYILPYLEYTVPSIASASTQREDGIGTTTYLALQGAIYNGNFGNGNNIVKYFGYRVKGINDGWNAQTWYDITSSFNAKVTNTNGVLSLSFDDLQELHENGTSGGFTQGTRFDIQIKLSDGISTQEFNYIIGSTNVLDGKFLDSNYKDTSGDYHIGLGGLPHEDFIVNITTQSGLGAIAVDGVAFSGGGGTGAVDTVNGQSPDGNGNVEIDTDDIDEGTTNKWFSQDERTKLTGIASGAEVNVNADWNATSGDAQILNKPIIPTVITDHTLLSNIGTNTHAQIDTKLASIASGAEVNVNADWNATSGDAQILNKPIIPTVITDHTLLSNIGTNTHAQIDTKLASIASGAEVNVNADWNATSGDAQILNKPIIPTVITDHTLLSNIGTNTHAQIDTKLASIASGAEVNVNADWNATSGDAQILNKPIIPTVITDHTLLSNIGTNTHAQIDTKLASIASGAEVNVNADWNATSGDAQILNKPIIPTVITDHTLLSNIGTNTHAQIDTKLASIASGAEVNVNADWNATSGDAQILNKPIIPTVITDHTLLSNIGTNTHAQIDTKLASIADNSLSTVAHDTTLTGSGTSGDPLIVSSEIPRYTDVLPPMFGSNLIAIAEATADSTYYGLFPDGLAFGMLVYNNGLNPTGETRQPFTILFKEAEDNTQLATLNFILEGDLASLPIVNNLGVQLTGADIESSSVSYDGSTPNSYRVFRAMFTYAPGVITPSIVLLDELTNTSIANDGTVPMISTYTPTTDYQVATKKYVDTMINSLNEFLFTVSSLEELKYALAYGTDDCTKLIFSTYGSQTYLMLQANDTIPIIGTNAFYGFQFFEFPTALATTTFTTTGTNTNASLIFYMDFRISNTRINTTLDSLQIRVNNFYHSGLTYLMSSNVHIFYQHISSSGTLSGGTVEPITDFGIDYTLPTASTTVLGGVKVDGTTVTITNGVISSSGSNLTKATGAEIDTGTDNAKYVTAKALKDSHNVPSVVPSTTGNVLTSNGTDWVSSAPSGGGVTGDTLPIGGMIPWTSNTIPDNWLLCDGQAVSRTTYASLFAVVSTTYGVGDGTTTFNVPNIKGRTIVGRDSADTDFDVLGETRGAKTHTLATTEIPAHSHPFTTGSGSYISSGYLARAGYTAGSDYVTKDTGGGLAHNNIQPSIVENYIIKAQQSSGVVATVVDNLTSTSTTNALSANQGKVLSDASIRHIITVKPTSHASVTTTSAYQSVPIPMPTTAAVAGTLLTSGSNGVVIGTGVTKIMITASINWQYNSISAGEAGIAIYKNGNPWIDFLGCKINNSYVDSVSLPLQLQTVAAGDILTVRGSNNNIGYYAWYNFSLLTVEVVA